MGIDAPSLLLLCAVAFVLGLALRLSGRLGPLGGIVLLVALIVALAEGAHAWVDLYGRPVEGVIAAKSEAATASRGSYGSWSISHSYVAQLCYRLPELALLGVAPVWGRPDQEPEGPARLAAERCAGAPGDGMLRSTGVKLDEMTFDHLRPGDRTRARVGRPFDILEFAWPVGAPVLPWLPRVHLGDAGPVLVASARIVHVDVVAQGRYDEGQAVDLFQPFDLVRLRYMALGRPDPVEAVDKIDHGSVAGLAAGATVQISYPQSEPRDARILGGSRRYFWLNPLVDWGTELGLAALVILAAAGVPGLVRRLRRRAS